MSQCAPGPRSEEAPEPISRGPYRAAPTVRAGTSACLRGVLGPARARARKARDLRALPPYAAICMIAVGCVAIVRLYRELHRRQAMSPLQPTGRLRLDLCTSVLGLWR